MEKRSTAARRRRAAARKTPHTHDTRQTSSQEQAPSLAQESRARTADETSPPSPMPPETVVDALPPTRAGARSATLERPEAAPAAEAPSATIYQWESDDARLPQSGWTWAGNDVQEEVWRAVGSSSSTRLAQRFRDLVARLMPFSLRERAWWHPGAWRRSRMLMALGGLVALALVALIFSVSVATHTSHGVAARIEPPTSVEPHTGVVIQQPPAKNLPTVQAQGYTVGVWLSNSAPGTTDTIIVYTRVSADTNPMPGVPVMLVMQFPNGGDKTYGPAITDNYGLAWFPIPYSGQPAGHPVYITATATIVGQTASDTIAFVPH